MGAHRDALQHRADGPQLRRDLRRLRAMRRPCHLGRRDDGGKRQILTIENAELSPRIIKL